MGRRRQEGSGERLPRATKKRHKEKKKRQHQKPLPTAGYSKRDHKGEETKEYGPVGWSLRSVRWLARYVALIDPPDEMHLGVALYYFGSKELMRRMIEVGEQTQKGQLFLEHVHKVSVTTDKYASGSGYAPAVALRGLPSSPSTALLVLCLLSWRSWLVRAAGPTARQSSSFSARGGAGPSVRRARRVSPTGPPCSSSTSARPTRRPNAAPPN